MEDTAYSIACIHFQAEKTVYGETKADLHNNRGQVHRFLENYESAIVDYSLSLAIDPEYEEPKEALDEIADVQILF